MTGSVNPFEQMVGVRALLLKRQVAETHVLRFLGRWPRRRKGIIAMVACKDNRSWFFGMGSGGRSAARTHPLEEKINEILDLLPSFRGESLYLRLKYTPSNSLSTLSRSRIINPFTIRNTGGTGATGSCSNVRQAM